MQIGIFLAAKSSDYLFILSLLFIIYLVYNRHKYIYIHIFYTIFYTISSSNPFNRISLLDSSLSSHIMENQQGLLIYREEKDWFALFRLPVEKI